MSLEALKVKGIPHQSLEVDEVLNLWRKLYQSVVSGIQGTD
jgi:hypothetical protein